MPYWSYTTKPYFGGDAQKSQAKSSPNFKKTTLNSKPTRRLDIITLIEVLCREYQALCRGLESRLNRHTHYGKTNHSVNTITTQLTCVVSENKNHERNYLGLTRKQHERQFSFHQQSQTSDPETSVTVFRTSGLNSSPAAKTHTPPPPPPPHLPILLVLLYLLVFLWPTQRFLSICFFF